MLGSIKGTVGDDFQGIGDERDKEAAVVMVLWVAGGGLWVMVLKEQVA